MHKKTPSPEPAPEAQMTAESVPTLRSRKRKFARTAIWETAIELFARKGFDETTIDDISKAAGISSRTFFRYFSSKNELMTETALGYAIALTEAISGCPREYSPSEVLRETVSTVARQAAAFPHAEAILHIVMTSPSAREARMSRMPEVQRRVAEAYARRSGQSEEDVMPGMLASLTFMIMDLALQAWYEDGRRNMSAKVDRVFEALGRVIRSDGPRERDSRP